MFKHSYLPFKSIHSGLCSLKCLFTFCFRPSNGDFKGNLEVDQSQDLAPGRFSSTMLYLGLAAIIFVPIFKMVTHLPPYVGMMLSLGVVAVFAEIYSSAKFSLEALDKESHTSPVHHSLSKIELPSILFFLGILITDRSLYSSLGLALLKYRMPADLFLAVRHLPSFSLFRLQSCWCTLARLTWTCRMSTCRLPCIWPWRDTTRRLSG